MKTNWIVGLTVMLLVLARTAYPQTGSPIYSTESTKNIYTTLATTTVNQQVNQFSTELIAQMAGGPVLFDQTFNAAYSEPTVQAAVTQAAGVLTGAGATSYTGPTETSYSQTLVNSSSATVQTIVSVTSSVLATTYIGPITIMVGDNQSESFTLLPGQEDVDTLTTFNVGIDQTVTNTDTYLTTTVYDMVGSVVPVPEPSSAWVLGLGGIALGLYRWRRGKRGHH